MGLWSGAKSVVTKGLSIRVDKWMSLDHIEETFDRTKLVVQDLFKPQKSTRKESFEQAVDRLALTEEDIEQRKREFTKLTIAFIVIAILILGYGGVMLYKGKAWITLIAAFLSIYAFSQAFRFHFWLFQLKNKKLGCTFSEWMNSEVRMSPKSSSTPEDKDAPGDS